MGRLYPILLAGPALVATAAVAHAEPITAAFAAVAALMQAGGITGLLVTFAVNAALAIGVPRLPSARID